MTIPGRAVQIVMVTSFNVRSIIIREMLALARRSLRYSPVLFCEAFPSGSEIRQHRAER